MLDRPLSLAALADAPLEPLDSLARSGRAEPLGLDACDPLGLDACDPLGLALLVAGDLARVPAFEAACGRAFCAPAGEREPALLGLALPA